MKVSKKSTSNSVLTAKRSKVFIFTIVFMALGVALLFRAFAAPVTVDINLAAASGTGVTVVTDQNAEGGSYVQFNDTTPPPPDPDPPPTGSILPNKFVGIWHPSYWNTLPSTHNGRYNLYFHAFAILTGSGSVLVDTGTVNRQQMINEYQALIADGTPVILSIGGEAGSGSGLNSQEHVNNFLASVIPIITEFGFSGVDWDIEEGAPGGVSTQGLYNASMALKQQFGDDFLISMAPYGSVEDSYKPLACLLGDDLAMVGYQFYNYNAQPTSSFIISKFQEWMTDCGLRQDQFAIGFTINHAWPAGFTTNTSIMASVYSEVVQAMPNIRGAWLWDVQQDMNSGYSFADTLNPVVQP